MFEIIKAMRPEQWYKNLIVFVGIIFSGNLFSADAFLKVLFAFIMVSLISGVNYIINDIKDRERDKSHPTKKNRPIASGRLSVKTAVGFSVIALLADIFFSFYLNYAFGIGITLFFLIGIAYTFVLKNIFLVDIIVISLNFVWRAILGAIVINIVPSMWLIVIAFLVALMLALSKRKGEIALMGEGAAAYRKNLVHYNSQMLDYLIIFTLAGIFVSYSIYSIIVKAGTYIEATMPLVIYLIFKYVNYLIVQPKVLATPERFLYDRSILAALFLSVMVVVFVLYAPSGIFGV